MLKITLNHKMLIAFLALAGGFYYLLFTYNPSMEITIAAFILTIIAYILGRFHGEKIYLGKTKAIGEGSTMSNPPVYNR